MIPAEFSFTPRFSAASVWSRPLVIICAANSETLRRRATNSSVTIFSASICRATSFSVSTLSAVSCDVTIPSITVARCRIASSVTTRRFVFTSIAFTTPAASSDVIRSCWAVTALSASAVPVSVLDELRVRASVSGSSVAFLAAVAVWVAVVAVFCAAAMSFSSWSSFVLTSLMILPPLSICPCPFLSASSSSWREFFRFSMSLLKSAMVSPSHRRGVLVRSKYIVYSFLRAILMPWGTDAGVRSR